MANSYTTLFSSWSKNPYSYLKLMLYVTIFVLNVIVLISSGLVTKTTAENKSINVLVGNIAVIQLFGIWTMVFEALGIVTLRHPATCALQTGSFATVVVISSWTLCMLSLDCYRHLCNKWTITSKGAMGFNVITWILGTVMIIIPHVLSYKSGQISKGPCCFLTVTAFSMLIITFFIILVSIVITLWTYVLTLIEVFKTDPNDWNDVYSKTVTSNNNVARTHIVVINENCAPSDLVKEVLGTAFENKVANISIGNNINDQTDSESTTSCNSENSDLSDYPEVKYSNERIDTTDVEDGMNNIEMHKLKNISTINADCCEENISNQLIDDPAMLIDSEAETEKEDFSHSVSKEIQEGNKSGHVKSNVDIDDNKCKTDKDYINNASAVEAESSESLAHLKPVILVCLLNFCFIVAWTPYLTIVFIYISVCGFADKAQICNDLETNLYPAVITIGIIDWAINPVIYFYVRKSI